MIPSSGSDTVRTKALAQVKALTSQSKTVIPSTSAAGRPLYAVVAIMCYLASLALGLTLSVRQMANDYAKDLSGAVTVQIKPSDVSEPDQQMERVLDVLNATAGLYDITPLSAADSASLVEPYIGRGNLPPDVALPQIVDVRLDDSVVPDLESLGEKLSREVPGATLNDHSRWKSRLLAFSISLQAMSLAALVLILFAAIAIVAFATRAAMAANQDIVEVLHLTGAQDKFIAAEFQGHFVRLGLWAGLTGAICAGLTLAFAGQMVIGSDYFIPGLSLGLYAYGALIFVPLISALVAMITARVTALSVVRRIL